MYFYRNQSTNPYFNLALEEYLFMHEQLKMPLFMLWQNDNTIVVGRNQNVMEEINLQFVNDMNTKVVRRNTGGGTVYHDLGNVNYTFIQEKDSSIGMDFSQFSVPIIKTLQKWGVKAECTKRNDLRINDFKFSGTAQTEKKGRILHHGTLLFNSDLNFLRAALRTKNDKFQSKSIQSVRSSITNISEHLSEKISIDDFFNELINVMQAEASLESLLLSERDLSEINKLVQDKYQKWEWNYGHSPGYQVEKVRCLSNDSNPIKIKIDVNRHGRINTIQFEGPFNGRIQIQDLENILKNKEMKSAVLLETLSFCNINNFMPEINSNELVEMILN
ncbi:lipoate--protein ligase [Acetobacterium woodii]|uniref:lipoate--protein ligase n=1 Tax=Acetobacterium woodii (strain ATCC 29683 / DSM 1030 / JCM 2381 / KCTC 1655 / WB1) TaxID=931626 RepID=H6LD67_ACEWD|nr:lipoate--protein ligase [Acetobacterium woodii]AFA49112.1 lipoate-protein ligase A [Acetobacterium woodii DSM 1030]